MIPAERDAEPIVLVSEAKLARINDALDAGIKALVDLSKTGSLHKYKREAALEKLWEARQDQIFL